MFGSKWLRTSPHSATICRLNRLGQKCATLELIKVRANAESPENRPRVVLSPAELSSPGEVLSTVLRLRAVDTVDTYKGVGSRGRETSELTESEMQRGKRKPPEKFESSTGK